MSIFWVVHGIRPTLPEPHPIGTLCRVDRCHAYPNWIGRFVTVIGSQIVVKTLATELSYKTEPSPIPGEYCWCHPCLVPFVPPPPEGLELEESTDLVAPQPIKEPERVE